MFCPACGVALAQQMKYCNRCGSELTTGKGAAEMDSFEKRLHDGLVGLFMVTVFGLGIIIGGVALLSNVLQLAEWVLVAFVILSSAAFAINFALSVWQIRRLARMAEEAKGNLQVEQLNTNKLGTISTRAALEAVPSVTESTTRTLELIAKEDIP